MRLRFSITIKKGPQIVNVIQGFKEVDTDNITVEQMQEVLALEQSIERFTGYRVHIETEYLTAELVESNVRS